MLTNLKHCLCKNDNMLWCSVSTQMYRRIFISGNIFSPKVSEWMERLKDLKCFILISIDEKFSIFKQFVKMLLIKHFIKMYVKFNCENTPCTTWLCWKTAFGFGGRNRDTGSYFGSANKWCGEVLVFCWFLNYMP